MPSVCSGTMRIGLTIRKMHGLSVGCPLPHSLEVFSPSSVRKCNGFNFIFAPDNTQEMIMKCPDFPLFQKFVPVKSIV